MNRANPLAFLLACLFLVFACVAAGGCATDPATGQQHVDPALVKSVIDDAADLATVYATIFTEPGPDQDKVLLQIRTAKALADLPALERLIADLKGKAPAATTP